MTTKPINSRRMLLALAATTVLATSAFQSASAQDVVFLSTQLRPIEEAQKVRDVLLKDGPKTNFIVEEPARLNVRVDAEMKAGTRTFSVIGALHGELSGLPAGAIGPVDDIMAKLKDRGMPDAIANLGKLGGDKQLYIPWMQATYIMAANKQALKHLPAGADINALTYDQLAVWADNVRKATGERKLGFPAGPTGLMARFFQGYLYPSYTGGVVSTFKSQEAEAMWGSFKALWANVNPSSTSYNFMQEPLATGEVWIAFDHIARLKDALAAKPDDFVTFPAPSAGKGRGFMPVIAGFAVPNGGPNRAGAEALIAHMTSAKVQLAHAREVGFFPVVKADLPVDMPAGTKLLASAIATQAASKDALVSLLPVGLGGKGGEFNKVYNDTFQRIVLRNEDIKTVLASQAVALKAIMDETKAPCWAPDKASTGPCPIN
ncbi:MAG: ABC transporter substrate-binding protein [Beijerinckiaceae bacterium]